MRFLLFFASCTFLFGFSLAHANSEESSDMRTVHTVPHPPHDHHEDNHVKKLDESLKRSREEEWEDD